MKILYYDCFSGISGDMNLGAMIDLGVPLAYLTGELKKVDIDPYEILMHSDKRKGIAGTRIEVAILPHDPSHGHRTFHDISGLIQQSGLSENVKMISLKIFEKLARAEAHIHSQEMENVHFHEIGAVDSIIDIVGAAVCLDYFKVDRIMSSPVQVGGGFVKCAHGILPVPAPATAEILKGIPVKSGLVPFETTTPTGAAILAATVDNFTDNINIIAGKIGYGIGQRDTEVPNVLRVYLGEMDNPAFDEDVEVKEAYLVECNIDDMNPELYGWILDALFEKGAYDAYLAPIIMKKSRPAVKISILCGAGELKDIEEILWLQTTTFGLRVAKVRKKMLRRDFSTQLTKYGEVSVKNGYFRGKKIKSKPEYEDCRKLAGEKGVGIKDIYDSLDKND
ncbi:MAG: nickel pincer cofactor biosynthesis protein LarC [Smithella sp.]